MKISNNGTALNYELVGNSKAPVVALSHSLGTSLNMWNPQMDALKNNYRILRYDTRGHGKSEVTTGPYTMDMLMNDAIGLLDELEISKVHWVGLSMGGMIGQGIALAAPNRLSSLSLCDTMSVVSGESKAIWKQHIQAAESLGLTKLVDFAMEGFFTESFRNMNSEDYQQIQSQFLATNVVGYIGCCHAIYQIDYSDKLHRINTPTQIIVGLEDKITPVPEALFMQKHIENSSLDVVLGSAHLSNIEQSETFNDILLNFLDSQTA